MFIDLVYFSTLFWVVFSLEYKEKSILVGKKDIKISYIKYDERDFLAFMLFSYDVDITNIDYSANTSFLVWSDFGEIKIIKLNSELFGSANSCQKLNRYPMTRTIRKKEVYFNLFTVNWIHNLVYYVSQEEKQILVANLSVSEYRAIIVQNIKDNVDNLKVDPINQYLFWTQWDATLNCVELMRSNLDGSQQITLLQTPGPIGLKFAIDSSKREIYLFSTTLYIMDFDGQDFRTVNNIIRQTVSVNIELDYCGHRLFIADMKNGSVTVVNTLDHEFSKSELYLTSQSIYFFKVVHTSCQTVKQNEILLLDQCLNNNCSHLCVPKNNSFYTCLCPLRERNQAKKKCLSRESFGVNSQTINSTPTQQTDHKTRIFVVMLLLLVLIFGLISAAYYFKDKFRNIINVTRRRMAVWPSYKFTSVAMHT